MPTPFADTSFLLSLYGSDTNTARARETVGRLAAPIAVTALGRFELTNAVRLAVFRKLLSQGDAAIIANAFQSDLQGGRLQFVVCDLSTIVDQALRLSEAHTTSGGHRAFDILHVATAKTLKASLFLSFDQNQRRLATAERLNVAP